MSIKVATEHTGPGSRELTEYFALDFDYADGGMFMLYRKETAQADGIGLEVTGQEASGERKGDTDFSVDEFIRLRQTLSGLRLEIVWRQSRFATHHQNNEKTKPALLPSPEVAAVAYKKCCQLSVKA